MNNTNDNDTCCICLINYDELISMFNNNIRYTFSCNHDICIFCCKRYEQNKCPLCRSSITIDKKKLLTNIEDAINKCYTKLIINKNEIRKQFNSIVELIPLEYYNNIYFEGCYEYLTNTETSELFKKHIDISLKKKSTRRIIRTRSDFIYYTTNMDNIIKEARSYYIFLKNLYSNGLENNIDFN